MSEKSLLQAILPGQPAVADSRNPVERLQAQSPDAGRSHGRISDKKIRAIREGLPIEQIIAEYIDLRKSGQELQGLCPFHVERTASFFVNPAKQVYYCFGCNQGGDIFCFFSRVEGVNFPLAVKCLALRAGISLNDHESVCQIRKVKQERDTEEELARRLAKLQYSLLLTLADELETLRGIYRKAHAGLEAGQRPESCWAALEYVADAIPRADTAYCITAFAAPVERAKFALHPKQRPEMIVAALERGFVADATGYRFEVPVQ